jgi:Zn-dependent protease
VRALLLLLGGLKFGKILLTGGTMLLSVIAYSWIFGWWYAVGFVALIFVHEMGHYIAARRRGLDVGAPTYIPFVGAWIQMKEMPHDAEVEAYVGLAGPLVGTLGALVCFYLARHFDSQLLLALSYAGFFINLINLIPLSPFDGGRVTAVISPKLWLIGAPILVAKAWRGPQTDEERAHYNVGFEARANYGFFYIGLVIFLAVMCHDLQQELPKAH